MKKIVYSIAIGVIMLGTSFSSFANNGSVPTQPCKNAAPAHKSDLLPDTCDQMHLVVYETGKGTSKPLCQTQPSAARLNAAFFSESDAAIVKLFKDETTIKLNNQHEADLILASQFFLENETSIAIR